MKFCESLLKEYWLGWEDSNLRIQVPKTCVLPLDDTPIYFQISDFRLRMAHPKIQNLKSTLGSIVKGGCGLS